MADLADDEVWDELPEIKVDPLESRSALLKERSSVERAGVPLKIYASWIKEELDKEKACLELPFTIIILASFSILATTHLDQKTVMFVENAISLDIAGNANFAWSNQYGHKSMIDVNSYADFWSWARLGFIPLIAPEVPWLYSEELSKAVPNRTASGFPLYNSGNLPPQWDFPGHTQSVPVPNDYLRFNRIIGGIRFRQQIFEEGHCVFPGDKEVFAKWLGKPCASTHGEELPPDLFLAETLDLPDRVEWVATNRLPYNKLIQQVIDMEDGCSSALATNRTCLCEWCSAQTPPHPWLNELTKRIEISFVIYNPQFGLYGSVGINFFFNRAGHIHKLINVRSSWAGVAVLPMSKAVWFSLSGLVWTMSVLYVMSSELKEIIELVRSKRKPWYQTVGDDYLGFWNVVDWISIVLAMIIIAFFAMLQIQTNSVNSEMAVIATQATRQAANSVPVETREEWLTQMRVFYESVDGMLAMELLCRFYLCMYPLVMMLRLFKSFAAQPRLAVVTQTFAVAQTDMLHFFIVFFSVYICMVVQAVLFFGQDILEFSTFVRAFHACFRALFGEWDWDAFQQIGRVKAVAWFGAFLLMMVLVLFNVLLAILMESYGQVKAAAAEAASLGQQVFQMNRRYWQAKHGERVRLNDIYEVLLDEQKGDEAALLDSNQPIFPSHIIGLFEAKNKSITKEQATRTLRSSKDDFDRQNETSYGAEEMRPQLQRMCKRVDKTVLCSAWLSAKIYGYQQEEDALQVKRAAEDEARGGSASQPLLGPPPQVTAVSLPQPPCSEEVALQPLPPLPPPDSIPPTGAVSCAAVAAAAANMVAEDRQLEAVRKIAQDRTEEIADGMVSVLAEEMRGLERRHKEQEKSMEQMQVSLEGMRSLMKNLNRTCAEVAELAAEVASFDDEAGLIDTAAGVNAATRARSASPAFCSAAAPIDEAARWRGLADGPASSSAGAFAVGGAPGGMPNGYHRKT